MQAPALTDAAARWRWVSCLVLRPMCLRQVDGATGWATAAAGQLFIHGAQLPLNVCRGLGKLNRAPLPTGRGGQRQARFQRRQECVALGLELFGGEVAVDTHAPMV